MADLRDTLQATLGENFTVERELGGGGMSHVFLAKDLALGRSIVVKVLPQEAADVSMERFKREIAVAAKLQYPHIVSLISAGNIQGLAYFTMPLVEGESLRGRLARGEKFSISETVSILKDIALALAYAHERGVVHRDIKPDNVLLTGGSAVVTDFGIAKALADARTVEIGGSAASTLTQAGVALGTPAYMSPEQASGDPNADHRMDIYAFGCVAYELLTGGPPFVGTPRELLLGHLTEQPEPVERRRADCPILLAQLTMRCLEKDPARRPQSASELLQSLDAMVTPTLRTVWWAPPKGRRSIAAWAIVATIVIAAALGLAWRRAHEDGRKRLAVVPFANVGGDSTEQYFAEGISDELTTALGRLPGVFVTSRNLMYRYRGKRDVDARDVGRALNVGYVVQGSIRRAGGRMHISAQLASASDGRELWADEMERDAKDVFAAQNHITESIASKLEPQLTVASSRTSTTGTSNTEAYDLYLRGRFLLDRRGQGVPLSITNFQQAIARDSNFGRAYAGLSLAFELMPYFGGVPAYEVRARVWDAAHRALAIDSTLAEAHTALGMLYQHEWKWNVALEEHRHAVKLNSQSAEARIQYGRTLLYTGAVREAHEEFKRCRQIDPYSAVASSWLSSTFVATGQPDSAVAELNRAIQIDSTNMVAIGGGGQTLVDMGRIDQARELSGRMPPGSTVFAIYKGYVSARTGDRAGALRILHELESKERRPWMGEIAIAMTALGLGDTTRALDALQRATEKREIWPSFVAVIEPPYDAIRHSKRFAALIRAVNLDDKLLTRSEWGRARQPDGR